MDGAGDVYAVNTFGAQGLASRHAIGGGTALYTFDERGNVAERLDANGNPTSADLYDGFGKKVYGPADVWGFGAQDGYYTDTETGLLLLTHRYYDPQQGRFLTRDPAGYGGGIDLYGYAGNNPINEIDPEGLDPNYYKSTFYSDPTHWHGGQPPLPDVPSGFNIDDNIAQSLKHPAGPGVPISTFTGSMKWFINQVHPGPNHPWNIKSMINPATGKPYGEAADPAGNFNYGACGKGMGLPSPTIYDGGGQAQSKGGPMGWGSHPEWGDPPLLSNGYYGTPPYYGDDPAGHHETNNGITYYEYWYAPQHHLPSHHY